MEGNQGKRAVLAFVGIAVLVIAVVGVSFAFFTYSRTGSGNNIITAGKITFNFADTSYIKLTNHFPITTTQGLALAGADNTCVFTVTGNTTTGSTINFAVYAIPGDLSTVVDDINAEQFTTKFDDSEVFTNIQLNGAATSGITFSPAMTASQGKAISTLTGTASNAGTAPANGKLLGTGTITGNGTDLSQSFIVRMWVDSSVVYVDDTVATHHYTPEAYSHLYYTMKIVVTAQQ